MDTENDVTKHFTATTYIVYGGRVLFLEHRKINTWLPPGGHVEPNELPHETALREIMEEAGLEVELILDKSFIAQKDFLNKNDSRIQIVPRPWKLLLEKIGENHYHIDFIYLANAKSDIVQNNEGHNFKWLSKKELEQDQTLFPNVKYFAILAIKKLSPS